MPAVIESTLYDAPLPGGSVVPGSTQQNSRDDLRLGYQVVMRSVQEATTYSWTLSFASDSPGTTVPGTPFDGTNSASALLAPDGSTSRDAQFNVDYEGTYLIRLTVDAGLPTEDSQFIRARVLTIFGALKLIAAGERRDEKGVIPVDATAEGWANDQNANMQRIAILLRRVSQSGRILFVDSNRGRDISEDQDDYDNVISIPGPETARVEETGIKLRAMAHGDFSSINEAITYAAAATGRSEPAPSKTNPYIIMVRPGLYEEDLNLTSHVHIVGTGNRPFGNILTASIDTDRGVPIIRSVNTGGTGTHRYNPQNPYTTDSCVLVNLMLESTINSDQPTLDHQGGLLALLGCGVKQSGDAVNQGEAIRCVVSNAAWTPFLSLEESVLFTGVTTADRVALRFDTDGGELRSNGTKIFAPNCFGVIANESMYEDSTVIFERSFILADTSAYVGYAASQDFTRTTLEAAGAGPTIDVSSFGGNKSGDVVVKGTYSIVTGDLSFETAAVLVTSQLSVGSWEFLTGEILLPDAPGDLPTTYEPNIQSRTLQYEASAPDPLAGPGASDAVPAGKQLPATNVQEAIDILVLAVFGTTGSPFYDLNQAYNGLSTLSPPTAGVGLGRLINALGGAVQIQGGTAPLSLDNQLKHGGLQVEGVIDIGGFINGGVNDLLVDVGHSEILLSPNMMGVGPFIAFGRATWTTGAPAGRAVILADQSPTAESFDMHLRTAEGRAAGAGQLGNVYVAGGSNVDAASVDLPGSVHIIGGAVSNAAIATSNVYIGPGAGGTGGGTYFVGLLNRTVASLEAVNVFAGGQAGVIYIGTPNGVEGFTFTGVEDLTASIAVFNAGRTLTAAEAPGGSITLYAQADPSSDIIYIGDSVAGLLNTALGDFRPTTATFTPGDYGDKVLVDVPSDDTLRINGDLEVTGSIIASTSYKAVVEGDDPYTTLVTEKIIGVTLTATSNITINLVATYVTGDKVVIKDEAGIADAIPEAGGQKIIIADGGGNNIDGAATLDITTAYGAVTLYKAASGHWFII